MAATCANIFIIIFLLSFYLICSVRVVDTFDPFGVVAGGAAIVFKYARCAFRECCENINLNDTGLQYDLSSQLHGQHLVADTVIRLVRGHVNNPHPAKALVLSFHGWTGSGKNFVGKIIAQNLFEKGMKSKFVNMFIATHHFPHVGLSDQYKDDLRSWIRGNVSSCGKALFIFDEMDKMPVKVLDAIKPFIDHHEQIDGVDYRKAIFLFLSNSGGHAITEKALDHWRKGLDRTDLVLKDIEHLVTISAFNEEGGLWHSSLIEKNLVSAFIPFLPMERAHVKLCARDDLRRKNHKVSEDILNSVADMLQYYPPDALLYSNSGCKRVSQKVDLVLDDRNFS